MIAQLQADATASYRTFRTPRELGRLVREDLATLLSERFAATASRPRTALGGRSCRALHAGDVDRADRSGGRHRRRGRPAGVTGGPARHADRSGRHRQDATGDRRRRSAAANDRRRRGRCSCRSPRSTSRSSCCPAIAAAVGAVVEGTRTPLDVLIEHFADNPSLLVLDNLEQVVAVAPELDRLLTACPVVKILATSRAVLRLRAEREYPVATLSVPAFPARPSIAEASLLPAVQLFVDRAQAVRYDFELTERQRRRGRRDLPPPRRSAARHRAGCRSDPPARSGRAAGAFGERARRTRNRPGRSPGAAAQPARHDRMERQPARRRRAET